MNWAIIDAGAFDFAADAWGYSYGGAVEWSQDAWTLRGGLFDMSRAPNGTELVRGFGQYQVDAELERRLSLFGEDGKIKLLAFVSRARLGSYKDAVALAAATHQPANTVPWWKGLIPVRADRSISNRPLAAIWESSCA